MQQTSCTNDRFFCDTGKIEVERGVESVEEGRLREKAVREVGERRGLDGKREILSLLNQSWLDYKSTLTPGYRDGKRE